MKVPVEILVLPVDQTDISCIRIVFQGIISDFIGKSFLSDVNIRNKSSTQPLRSQRKGCFNVRTSDGCLWMESAGFKNPLTDLPKDLLFCQ